MRRHRERCGIGMADAVSTVELAGGVADFDVVSTAV